MARDGCTPGAFRLGRLALSAALGALVLAPVPAAHAALFSDAQPTEVTVRASVGGFAPVTIDIGTSTAYGRTVSASVVPADTEGSSPVAAARVTGLAPDTLYHWRARETGALPGADTTIRTSPEGAPATAAVPSAAYVGSGPSARCTSGAWSDDQAAVTYAWSNDISIWVLSPVHIDGPVLNYSVAGRYRCTVTARNGAGSSTASVLFTALSGRIPLRVVSRPALDIVGADDGRRAVCRDWGVAGGGGQTSVVYRWYRNEALIEDAADDSLALPAAYGGRIACEVVVTRGQQTVSARSDTYDDGQPPPAPTPVAVAPALIVPGMTVASSDPPARTVVIGSPGDPGATETSIDLDEPFDVTAARSMARQALDEEFGTVWKRRSKLRLSCQQRSSTRYRCRVSWKYKGTYEGDVWIVVPSSTDAPITVSVEVSRPQGKKLKKRWVTARELKRLAALERPGD